MFMFALTILYIFFADLIDFFSYRYELSQVDTHTVQFYILCKIQPLFGTTQLLGLEIYTS